MAEGQAGCKSGAQVDVLGSDEKLEIWRQTQESAGLDAQVRPAKTA